jgi:hypothetical protein
MYTVDLLLSLAPIIPRTGPLKSGHTIVFSFSLSTVFFLWNTVYCLDVVHEYQILVAFVVVVWKQGTRDETFIKKKHPCFFITNSKNIFSCEKIHEPSPSHNGNQIMDLYPACRERHVERPDDVSPSWISLFTKTYGVCGAISAPPLPEGKDPFHVFGWFSLSSH